MRHAWMLVCLLSGCAVHRTLQPAQLAAEQGDWPRALALYTDAVQRFPESELARERWQFARRAAREVWLTRAVEALEQGRYGDAEEAVAQASRLAPDDPRVHTLAKRIPWARMAEIRSMAELGQVEAAWREAVAFSRAHPGHPAARRLREDLRHEVVREAYRLYDLGQPGEAARHLGVLLEEEPDLAPAVQSKIDELEEAWAAGLRRQWLQAQEQGLVATAWAGATIAGHLSGDPRDLEAARRLRRGFVEEHQVRAHVEVLGDGTGLEHWRARLVATFSGASLVTWTPAPEHADVRGTLEVAPLRCVDEPGAARRESHEVVRGEEAVPNPEWTRRSEELAALKEAMARPDGEDATLLAARTEAREAFDALPRLRAAEVEARTMGDKAAHAAARQAMEAATERAQHAREVLAQAQQQSAPDAGRRQRLQQAIEVADGRLEETPQTVLRPRVVTAEVEVVPWTRRCEQVVRIGFGDGEPAVLSAVHTLRDSTHSGVPRLGLAPDPLDFGHGEEEIAAEASAELTALVDNHLRRALSEERERRLTVARGAQGDQALAMVLSAWLLDPGHPPDELEPLLTELFGWPLVEAFLEPGPAARRG